MSNHIFLFDFKFNIILPIFCLYIITYVCKEVFLFKWIGIREYFVCIGEESARRFEDFLHIRQGKWVSTPLGSYGCQFCSIVIFVVRVMLLLYVYLLLYIFFFLLRFCHAIFWLVLFKVWLCFVWGTILPAYPIEISFGSQAWHHV